MNVIKQMWIAALAMLLFAESCRKENQNELSAIKSKQDTSNPSTAGSACDATMFKDAAEKQRFETMEKNVQVFLSSKGRHFEKSMPVVTVPVVFHVVWNTADQDIPDQQLQSQITVFNADYSATNSDVGNTPACFQPLVGNAQFHFVLAQRDPNGNATTGITRTNTKVTSFSSDGSVCVDSLGGCNAWPSSQYLNIWVCNKTGAAGFSAYPWSGNPATDGIIVAYNYVGTVGTFDYNWSYLLGRTLTHEVGHWFGLIHIWGDAVCGNDYVNDTPLQEAANGSCPTFPHMSSCSPNSNGDMYMNYMDYTYDACRVMFSAGQVQRMLGYLNTTRVSLLTSQGGNPPTGAACNVPSGLSVSGITAGGATLNWVSTGASSYNVQYKVSSASNWTTISSTANSISFTSLSASTSYLFQVQSVCSGSSSAYSASSSFSTSSPSCTVPSGLSASSVTSSSAILSWGSTGAIKYNVQYKPTSSTTWLSASSISNSITISSLSASTSYQFEVQSVCSASSGSSAFSSAAGFTTSTPPCNVPAGLTASSVTATGATLSWTSTGAVSYNIQYKSVTSSTWLSASSSVNSLVLTNLSASSTYQFQVQSVCSGSSSSYSASSSFSTTASLACAIPSGLSASSVTATSAVLNWASTGVSGYNLSYRQVGAVDWISTSTSSISLPVYGLTAATNYEFMVQSICSNGYSAFSTHGTFTTP